jgi:single-strand DNA-binding protein
MYSQTIMIGRLVADPESRSTGSGVSVVNFRIAVDRPIASDARNNPDVQKSDFFDVVAWKQNADFVVKYIGKGRLIMCSGRLQTREYQANDGTKRKVVELVAEIVKPLDRAKEGDGDNTQSSGNTGYTRGTQAQRGRSSGQPTSAPDYKSTPVSNGFDDIGDPFDD